MPSAEAGRMAWLNQGVRALWREVLLSQMAKGDTGKEGIMVQSTTTAEEERAKES